MTYSSLFRLLIAYLVFFYLVSDMQDRVRGLLLGLNASQVQMVTQLCKTSLMMRMVMKKPRVNRKWFLPLPQH